MRQSGRQMPQAYSGISAASDTCGGPPPSERAPSVTSARAAAVRACRRRHPRGRGGGVEGEGRERGRADPDAALAEVVREHRVELVVDDDEVDRAAVSSTQYL
jgi:hypothetical protein